MPLAPRHSPTSSLAGPNRGKRGQKCQKSIKKPPNYEIVLQRPTSPGAPSNGSFGPAAAPGGFWAQLLRSEGQGHGAGCPRRARLAEEPHASGTSPQRPTAAGRGTNGPAPHRAAPRRLSPLGPRRRKAGRKGERTSVTVELPAASAPVPPFSLPPSFPSPRRRRAPRLPPSAERRGREVRYLELGGSLTCARLFQWQRTCRAAPPNQLAARPSAPRL